MTDLVTRTVSWTSLRGPKAAGVDVHRTTQRDMAVHDHLFHEIVFVEEGGGVHVTAAGRASLRPGDVVVLRPQVWHGYEQTHELRIINCLVDSRLIARYGSLLAQAPGSFDLYRRRTRQAQAETHAHLHARPTQARMMLDRLNQIIAEQRQQLPGWRAAAAVGAMDVLVNCARLASQEDQPASELKVIQTDAPSRAQQAVQDATAIIESKFHHAMTLDELAGAVHLSPGHLSRTFGRYMGMSVVSFIHRLRAEEACRLLTATKQPVSEIGLAVGYEEVAYFSRCFKQQIGMSPSQYRQEGAKPVRRAD